MNYGLTTIVNANGSMADLEDDAVWKLPDDFTDVQLIQALETLWKNAELRKTLGTRAREIILEKHTPSACAAQYHEALERFSASSASDISALVSAIADIDSTFDDRELTGISQAIALNTPRSFGARQVFVDISALVQHDPERESKPAVGGIVRKWFTVRRPGLGRTRLQRANFRLPVCAAVHASDARLSWRCARRRSY